METRASASLREEERRRWRAAILPVWPAIRRRLTPREATVLTLRLGLLSDVPLTQARVAARLGVTTNGVAAIEARAKAKARAVLGPLDWAASGEISP